MGKLVLIDGHSVLYRAFHAIPMLTTSKGELINAVYGFTSILLNVIKELEPSHLAVTFDRDKPTFRHTQFAGYKAQREEMPTELADQKERVEEVVKALNIPIFAVEGFEADDVIASLATQSKHEARSTKFETIIVSADNDLLQLVDTDGKVKVKVYIPGRGKKPALIYDESEVEKKYGLEPEQIPDFKGLAGDASDNIPGVKGVGPKTASRLLREYKLIEKIYKKIEKVKEEFGEKVTQKLIEGQESAYLSKKLATVDREVPVELKLKACELDDYDRKKAVALFEELEFRSLIKKLPNDKFETMVQDIMF